MFWTATERWVLAAGAPLRERNSAGHEFIGGAPRGDKLDVEAKQILNRDWDLEDRSTLVVCLKHLLDDHEFEGASMEEFGAVNDTGRVYREELVAEHGAALHDKGMVAWNHVPHLRGWLGIPCGLAVGARILRERAGISAPPCLPRAAVQALRQRHLP